MSLTKAEQWIRDRLDELPEAVKATFVLAVLANVGAQHAADILECSLQTAEARIRQARRHLKENPYLGDDE